MKQNIFLRLWQGEVKLLNAYFEFYVFLPLLLGMVIRTLLFLYTSVYPGQEWTKLAILLFPYFYLFIYFPFITIAVWRCSKTTKTLFWRIVGRAILIINTFFWLRIMVLLFSGEEILKPLF